MPRMPSVMICQTWPRSAARLRQTAGRMNGVQMATASTQRRKAISVGAIMPAACLLTTVLADQMSTAKKGKR